MAPESSSFAFRDSSLVMRGIPSYEDQWPRLSFVLGKPLRPPSHRKLNKTRKIGRTSTAEIDFFLLRFPARPGMNVFKGLLSIVICAKTLVILRR